jgi:hypothetical protein
MVVRGEFSWDYVAFVFPLADTPLDEVHAVPV